MSSLSLFRKPFSPKKAPPRKAISKSTLQMDAVELNREFGVDYVQAHMDLSNRHLVFDPENGEWFDDENGDFFAQTKKNDKNQKTSTLNSKEIQKLQKSNQNLQEENNLLKVKNEILVDMISEVYSETTLQKNKKKIRVK